MTGHHSAWREARHVERDRLRIWVRRAEVAQGRRPGLTTDELTRLPQPDNECCHQHDDG